MNRIGFGLLAIFAVALGLVVGTFNSTSVRLDLLWIQLDWPLGLLVLMALVVGLLTGIALVYLAQVLPLKMRIRKLQADAARAPTGDRDPAVVDD